MLVQVRRLPPATQLDLVCTSGHAFMLMQLRVVNDAGKDVACDGKEVGEVYIKGDTVFKVYWQNEHVEWPNHVYGFGPTGFRQ